MDNVHIHSRGTLPHWEMVGAIYFITFRLADSLPQRVLAELQAELDRSPREWRSDSEQLQSNVRYQQKLNRYLDSGAGACHLSNPHVAKMVSDALQYFDGERYQLHAWCVMPNHVHLVLRLAPEQTLSRVMHSIKRYSAARANEILNREGRFWQPESYDHIVRNESAYYRIVEYVLNNPAKAGLMDWPYVSTPSDAVGWRSDVP